MTQSKNHHIIRFTIIFIAILLFSKMVYASGPALGVRVPVDENIFTIVSFRAKNVNQNSVLEWSTSSESSVARIEIERSDDAIKTWLTIGSVSATGNLNNTQNYSFTDINPEPIVHYYRLKAVFLDSSANYSRIIQLSLVIPIARFLTFDGIREGNSVKLTWSTSSEYNNETFAIERVKEGTSVPETIATINGSGTSTTEQHYQYIDKNPLIGNSIYSITAMNKDTRYPYERYVLVAFELITSVGPLPRQAQVIYPNPATAKINISNVKGNGLNSVSIRDQAGKTIIQHIPPQVDEIDIQRLPAGMYFLTVSDQFGSRKAIRFIKH